MPSESRFRDVEKLLNGAGYALARINGSHHIFTKPDRQPVSIPVHRGKVKPFYVRQIQKLIDEERGKPDAAAEEPPTGPAV